MIGSSFRCAVSFERPTDVTNAIDVNRFTCKMKRKKTVPNKSNGLHLAPIFFSMHTAPVGSVRILHRQKRRGKYGGKKKSRQIGFSCSSSRILHLHVHCRCLQGTVKSWIKWRNRESGVR
ncbi:Uncharacterized protein APZ42_027175 [Daphnia magna]|uniref:Uncharacterized protein n=1 Tax=Daphnia magna TaxID=35525 RepID=A0A164RBN2_9CRUS|nr:Uncharacterized protein APZ42_027175 [Daphnia magna]